METNRIIITVGVILALLGAAIGYTTNTWFGLAFFVTFFGGFILEGLVQIQADPPHLAQVTRFGKRLTKTFIVQNPHTGENEEKEVSVHKKEGWRFFPLRPYWYGYILVNVERTPFETVSEKTRTPDRAESRVPIFLTVEPHPDYLVPHINSGKMKGSLVQLIGKLQERLREWAMSLEEGPVDWRELNMSQLEGVSVLIKGVAWDSLTEIPDYAQDVPTWIWLRYSKKPRPTQFLKREKDWAAKNWERVEEVLRRIEREDGPEAVAALWTAVEARKEEVYNLRTGAGRILVEDLGLIISRLNLGDMDVLGEVGKIAEAEAREREERAAETLELAHVKARIRELMKPPLDFSPEEAKNIVQIERGKVSRTIDAKELSIAPESRDVVERVLATVLAGRGGK